MFIPIKTFEKTFKSSNAEVKNAWNYTSTPPYVFFQTSVEAH
jgi:hypothetical protein